MVAKANEPAEQKGEEARAKAEDSKKKEEPDDPGQLKDRLLRLAAEFDNYKKRSARELDNAKNVGKAEAVTKLLPTVDEFELAMASLGGKSETKGIELVFTNFKGVLKAMGLKEIETDGAFDPYKHEIVLTRESDKKEGTILEVLRKGYVLNGIMLRPASVIVSSSRTGDEEKKEETKEEKGG